MDQNNTQIDKKKPLENTPPEIEALEFELIDEEVVSLQKLSKWKKEGNYETIEYHIRQGHLEILPREDLIALIQVQEEHPVLLNSIELLLEGLEPLLQQKDLISSFLIPGPTIKFNMGKLITDLTVSTATGKMPAILKTFTNAVNEKELNKIPFEKLEEILRNNDINLKPLLDFLQLFGVQKSPNQISTSNPSTQP